MRENLKRIFTYDRALDIVIFIAIQRFKTKIWTIRQLMCTSNDMWRKLSIAIQYGDLDGNFSPEDNY